MSKKNFGEFFHRLCYSLTKDIFGGVNLTKISLASYSLKITNKDTGEIQDLNRILVGDNSIHINNILEDYFHLRTGEYFDHEQNQKFFTIQTYNHSLEYNGNLIRYHKHTGILETGSYGYSSKIYDRETNNVIFIKSPENPEMLPFFYGIYTPEEGTECICVFQRFSNFGFKTIFEDALVDYFKENYSNYRLALNPLLPSDYINNFINDGRILKLRLLKNGLPEDLADALGNNHNETSELIIKAEPRGDLHIMDRIRRILNGERTVTQAFEVQGFEYDNVKIEVRVGNTTRTLDLSELENITGYFDITEDVETENGHPIYDSIQEVSKVFAEHFLRERNIIN